MTLTKFVGILASGLAFTGAASAQGTDALSEIAQLKAEVAQLQASLEAAGFTATAAN